MANVIEPLTLTQFISWLQQEPDFSFARYGDGTFMALNGFEGLNCDGAEISSKQEAEIERSIRDETIAHGLGDLAISAGGADRWLESKQIKIRWFDANVLNTATQYGQLLPFIRWLREQRVVMLGPPHLENFPAFSVSQFIRVHPTSAFDQRQELQIWTEKAIVANKPTVVLISAGLAAPGLVSRLHQTDRPVHILDVGSIWDPFVGVFSRRWQRKTGWNGIKQLGKANFEQEIETWRIALPS